MLGPTGRYPALDHAEMVIPYLPPERIAAGAALLEGLDRARIKVDVAL
jgi:hypothetical protein